MSSSKIFKIFSASDLPFILRGGSAAMQFVAPFLAIWIHSSAEPAAILAEYVFIVTMLSISTAMTSFTLARIDSKSSRGLVLSMIPQVIPLVVVSVLTWFFEHTNPGVLLLVVLIQNSKESIAYRLRRAERNVSAALIRDFTQKLLLLLTILMTHVFVEEFTRSSVLTVISISYLASLTVDLFLAGFARRILNQETNQSVPGQSPWRSILADDICGRLNAAWLALPVFFVASGNSGISDQLTWMFLAAERAFRIFGLVVGQVSLETQYSIVMSAGRSQRNGYFEGLALQVKKYAKMLTLALVFSVILFVSISMFQLSLHFMARHWITGLASMIFFFLIITANLLNANAFLRDGWRQVFTKFVWAVVPVGLILLLQVEIDLALTLPFILVTILLPDLIYLFRICALYFIERRLSCR